MDSVPSNSHGNLDEQISQLMQCKPLSEQEVNLISLTLSFLYTFFPRGSGISLANFSSVALLYLDLLLAI